MTGKYKMTGCARFLIFLVILAPIAYFGSKYLRDSGTWDKIKEKVENTDSNAVERTIEEKRDRIEIPEGNVDNDQFDRLREAYEEQELILAKQDQKIEALQAENDALRRRVNNGTTTAQVPQPSPQTPTRDTRTTSNNGTSNRTGGAAGIPSLDDLLDEADQNLGTSSDRTGTQTSTAAKKSLATWSFVFNNTRGEIEFYSQGEKVMARTDYQGSNRVDISELTQRGDRLLVNGSQTGEYYVIRQDGDLDAYDQNGFQVTCIRK